MSAPEKPTLRDEIARVTEARLTFGQRGRASEPPRRSASPSTTPARGRP
jgi:hypothetical protein